MDILLSAIVVVVTAIAAFIYLDDRAQKALRAPKKPATDQQPPHCGVSAGPEAPDQKLVLKIAGTERIRRENLGFVRRFGISPDHVRDLVIRRGPGTLASLPEQLQAAVTDTYTEGRLLGPEARDLAQGADIGIGKALYLLLTAPPGVQPYLAGFIA